MVFFVPKENVKSDISYGRIINKLIKEYIEPELKKRGIKRFNVAGIEIFTEKSHKVHLDNELQIAIELKESKLKPTDVGKTLGIDLQEIKDLKWGNPNSDKKSAKILVIDFNKDWWIYYADHKKRKYLEEKFKVIRKFKIRGGGYLPLKLRRKEKDELIKQWKNDFEKELPLMWKRHITVSQKYRGVMVYDGNYFDLFFQAQDLYILGYYYSATIVCRTAAEQALISILTKTGHAFDIYKKTKGKRKLKSIEGLAETCRSYSLFRKKYPINKTSAKKLNQISTIASRLVHPKHDLDEQEKYKNDALRCMDNLQYVIKNHLNFVKDTGAVSGYKPAGTAKRLK